MYSTFSFGPSAAGRLAANSTTLSARIAAPSARDRRSKLRRSMLRTPACTLRARAELICRHHRCLLVESTGCNFACLNLFAPFVPARWRLSVNATALQTSLMMVLLCVVGFSSGAIAQEPREEALKRLLERFPAADANKDGKLSLEEA